MKELGKLDEDKYKIIENDLREEFLSLRQNIEDDNNEEIEVEPRNINNNNIVKKSISDTQNYFVMFYPWMHLYLDLDHVEDV